MKNSQKEKKLNDENSQKKLIGNIPNIFTVGISDFWPFNITAGHLRTFLQNEFNKIPKFVKNNYQIEEG